MGALVFREDETAYFEWLSQHPAGYVVNASSEPSPNYLVLHSARCKAISKPKPGAHAACFTGNGYIKVGADEIQDLNDWILEQGIDAFSKHCDLCNPGGRPIYRRFNWSRDELILALDLYHSLPAARGNKTHSGVIELSEILQELPIHRTDLRPPNFRNANGVAMKLVNFSAYDPEYSGVGLSQGATQLEQSVWNEFAGKHVELKRVATLIRELYPSIKSDDMYQLNNDDGAEEGGIMLAVHRFRERDKAVILRKKNEVFAQTMALKCEVCGFDFADVYGELGSQFAECHHTKPVSEMKAGEKTRQSDLSIVCANCHRMLHRNRDLLSINALKSVMLEEQALKARKRSFT